MQVLRAVRFIAAILAATIVPQFAGAVTTIHEEAELFSSTAAGQAGSSVSISGDTAVVGAPHKNSDTGQVDVYVRTPNTTTWTHQATLFPLVANALTTGDMFGASVSVFGNNIAVGAAGRSNSKGAVYLFNRAGTVWTQSQYLTVNGGLDGDKFGYSVSIEGLTVVAGAPFATIAGKSHVGAAYAFVSLNGGTTWAQQSSLVITTGQAKAEDHIGWSVAFSGNTALIGAPDDDFGSQTDAGSVYVFVRNGARWTKQGRINPGASTGFRVGSSVALRGNSAVLGVDGANSGQGFAYLYTRSGTSWTLNTTLAPPAGILSAQDGAAGDHFGASSAVSGSVIVIGAPQTGNATGGGKVYVFDVVGGVYAQTDALVANDNALADGFGASVAIDAGRALVGAPHATETSADNGASYVFIVKAASVTTIGTIVPEPSYAGQNYTVPFTVAHVLGGSGTPSGTVDVSDGNGGECLSVALVSGAGSCKLNSDVTKSLTISATYSGDSIFGGSSTTKTHNVNTVNTTTTLAFDADPSVVGQTINATVSVAAAPPVGVIISGPAPVGIVTVSDNVAGHPTCTVDIGVGSPPFTCPLTFTAPGGPYSYTASYASYPGVVGYAYNPSTSTAVAHTVVKASTTTTLQQDVNPSVVGQVVTFTVNVNPTSPGAGTPTGAVTVTNGAGLSCNIADITANNTCTITFTAPGSTSFSVSYPGDSNFNASASGPLAHTTNKADTTTTLVSGLPNPSVTGQTVTLMATVAVNAPGSAAIDGSITVSNRGVGPALVSCTISLPGNSCTASIGSAGASTFTATYNGNGNLNTSTSASLGHTVNKADTGITIVQNPNPSQTGQSVTISVTVAALPPGGGAPTGTVTVSAPGGIGVGCSPITLSGSQGSCTLTFAAAGSNIDIHAAYSGDTNFNTSTADVLHNVNLPTGNHLLFGTQPTNILVGNKLGTVTVQVRNAANVLQLGDNTTTITLSITACGVPVLFGPVTVSAGVATFTNVGRFYTAATGLTLTANSNPADTPATSNPFNVTAPNAQLLFSNGFESCRL